MFIMKRFMSRRTVLRGMGAAIGLPFLEAMTPALTATAQTAATPLKRFGVVFVPLGETRTTAEMSPAEKDAVSHRGKALRMLAPELVRLLGGTEGPPRPLL